MNRLPSLYYIYIFCTKRTLLQISHWDFLLPPSALQQHSVRPLLHDHKVVRKGASQGNPLKSKCDHKLDMFKQRKSTQILAVSKPPRRNDADPAQKVELSQASVSDHPVTSKLGNTRFTVVLVKVPHILRHSHTTTSNSMDPSLPILTFTCRYATAACKVAKAPLRCSVSRAKRLSPESGCSWKVNHFFPCRAGGQPGKNANGKRWGFFV